MTDANITQIFILQYINYLSNSRYPLTKSRSIYTDNLKVIDEYNPQFTNVLVYIMMNMKGSKELEKAFTFEFPKDWYVGRCRRDKASALLTDMVYHKILKKVSTNPRDWSYYVNPVIFNTLTHAQRGEYYDQYSWLFA